MIALNQKYVSKFASMEHKQIAIHQGWAQAHATSMENGLRENRLSDLSGAISLLKSRLK